MKFFKNLAGERYSGNLIVLNKGDQEEDNKYHGYLTYSVTLIRLSNKRDGRMVLYVPKSLEDLIGNFPYTLDVPVKASAKFIAWQLTFDNFNSTRWVRHAGYLTDCNSQLYRQIYKQVDEERKEAPQRERCERFILNWSNHHAPQGAGSMDKIEKIISAHHDDNRESQARQFLKPFIPGKGILSNDSLEKIAYTLAGDRETLAKKLGFTSDDINKIKSSQAGTVKQTLRMLVCGGCLIQPFKKEQT